MKEYNHNEKFPGFPPSPRMNFWSYPKDLNGYWHQLTGSEQKVLDYILRHTWGFDKTADEISLSQLERGIKGFDKGTGLSRPPIIVAIRGLVEKGFIKKSTGKKASRYELVKDFNYPSKDSLLAASKKSLPTIDKITIDNKQYPTSSLKKRPYFWNQEMRRKDGKWWVIPREGGPWQKFAATEQEIKWR